MHARGKIRDLWGSLKQFKQDIPLSHCGLALKSIMAVGCRFPADGFKLNALTGFKVRLLLTVQIVLIGFPYFSYSAQYTASGRLLYTGYNIKGEEIVKWERQFTVQVTECSWFITSRAVNEESLPEGFLQWEIGGDGKDTYYLRRYDGIPREAEVVGTSESGRAFKQSTNVIMHGGGNVHPGPVPFVESSMAPAIWLAYASHCYLADSVDTLRPIWEFDDPDLRYTDFRIKANWITLDSQISLPAKVIYFNPGKYYVKKGAKHVSIVADEPYNQGWTNAIYYVKDQTNNFGVSIPLVAEFLRFAPNPNGSSAQDLLVIQRTLLETLSITNLGLTEDFLPKITNEIVIRDYRHFQEIASPIGYKTAEQWLRKDELSSLRSFENQYKIALDNKKRNESYTIGIHTLALIFFGLLCVGLPVLYVILKKQSNNKPMKL